MPFLGGCETWADFFLFEGKSSKRKLSAGHVSHNLLCFIKPSERMNILHCYND